MRVSWKVDTTQVIIQAKVDFRGLFMDVYIGWPGKVHDARVFVNSLP